MEKRSKSRRVMVGVAILVALLAVLWMRMGSGAPPAQAPAAGNVTAGAGSASGDSAPPRAASSRREEHALGVDPVVRDAKASEYLREQFGATIDSKRTQIKALEKLIGYLMKNYPGDWQARVQALLAKTFPGLADQLYAQFQNMTAYNDWLKASQAELANMSPADKRDALREARFRFFGSDAGEIWEEALRNERIYDAMDAINQASDATVDQKLQSYLDAINESYGEGAPQFLERRQTELMNNFLVLPSVQDDLRAMTSADRQRELDRVRSAMGMDEEALKRWRDLDAERNHAWDTGSRYMEKRDEITRTFQGEEQARRLADLRSSLLGDEADTVREEEESGFFRYGHPRIYGKE